MKRVLKKLLAKPALLLNNLIIGFYLHTAKKKAADIKDFRLSDARVLILAPHQDDEILGCGCFIQQSLQLGNQVKCVFLTDGSKSFSEKIDDELTLVETRKAEAIKVAESLNMEVPEFLDREDGSLDHEDVEAANKIATIIEEYGPNVILFPYFLDGHKDHSAVSGILVKALKKVKNHETIKLYAYEINSPISVYGITHYVDCTCYAKGKMDSLKLYQSQTMSFESTLLMNKLNGIITDTAGGAELFREIDIVTYEKAYEKYNKDNNIWMRFRQMYSIYFMILAYFKGIGLKKEIAMFQEAGDVQIRSERDSRKGVDI